MGHSVRRVNAESIARSTSQTQTGAVSFLYDQQGNRKYLTIAERRAFLTAARHMPPESRTFCLVLAYTGARVSEALALTPERIDRVAGVVILESLKKRRRGVFRAIPVPPKVISALRRTHDFDAPRSDSPKRIWPWSRTTAWHVVKRCMIAAGIHGPQTSPKGLRHAFAIAALQAGVPITLVKKWLGHSRISTTEIYADAVGDEERQIASRFWKRF